MSALTHLEDKILSVTPKTDVHHGFVALARAGGLTPSLEERSNSTRFFMMELEAFPSDDGAAGLSGRRRASISLRVRYDIPQDQLFLQRMIAEDAEALLVKLKGPEYNFSETGIVSVIPEPPQIEPVGLDNDEAVILTLPFTLLYLEA